MEKRNPNKAVPNLAATPGPVSLYEGMRDQVVGKAELARRLGRHMPQVDCVLDVQQRSRLDMMDAALRAIGRQLHVTAAYTADPAEAAVTEETASQNWAD